MNPLKVVTERNYSTTFISDIMSKVVVSSFKQHVHLYRQFACRRLPIPEAFLGRIGVETWNKQPNDFGECNVGESWRLHVAIRQRMMFPNKIGAKIHGSWRFVRYTLALTT